MATSHPQNAVTFPTHALLHTSHLVKQNLKTEQQWVHGKFYLQIHQSLWSQATDTNPGSVEQKKINCCSDIGLKGGQNDSSERTEIKLLLGST